MIECSTRGRFGGEAHELIRISSRNNPHFKSLRLLVSSARERRRAQQTLLDGPHLVGSYLDRKARPALVAVSEAACDKPEIERLLGRAGTVEVLCFTPGLFEKLAPVHAPVGILALIDIPRPRERATRGDFLVLLDDIQDPGNVGTIIRAAAGAGADAVLLSPRCADPWSPRTLRAAMGAHFALEIHTGIDLHAAVREFHGRIIAAAGTGGRRPQAVNLSGPVGVIFGNEGAGLDPVLAEAAVATISIPLARGIESLNVGAAAAIILFERVRQLDRTGSRQAR